MFWRAQRSLVKPFGDACDQRRFGSDHDEIDGFIAAEGGDGLVVGDVERDQFGFLGDAGIARRGVKPGQHRRGRQLPGQRMLATAGTDEKNVHAAITCL
jgi:hypothetical protein